MKTVRQILVLIAVLSLISFGHHESKPRGIIFFKGSWNEALQKARDENKNIFLDVYATWCGPCKELRNKTFKDEEVADYFNRNFINVRLDGETDEGLEVARRYRVTSYPTLFIIAPDGRQLAKTTGFMKPHILVNFGRRVVP